MRVTLLDELELTFYSAQTEDEYIDGRPVRAELTEFKVRGSLHPYKEGRKSQTLPDGKFSTDAWVFRTKERLQPASQYTNCEGDFCEIEGEHYYVHDVEDWTKRGLSLIHYKALLVRRTLPTGRE